MASSFPYFGKDALISQGRLNIMETQGPVGLQPQVIHNGIQTKELIGFVLAVIVIIEVNIDYPEYDDNNRQYKPY